jgi:cytochrome c peroxidase
MKLKKVNNSFGKWIATFVIFFMIMASLAWFLFPKAPNESDLDDASANSILSNISKGNSNHPIQPIPHHIDLEPAKVALGERLFNEVRLSHDNTISCAHCHDLKLGGTDGLPKSVGINDSVGEVNSPTVFNSEFNFKQLWDGRADTLEEQISGPIQNPVEMGSSWTEVIEKLSASGEYVQAFNTVYPDGLTKDNIINAIATFERSLYTPNSRFDQFLQGDKTALSQIEQRGYSLFLEFGCVMCHQGIGIGGNMFQRMGAKNDYFKQRGNETKADLGRYNVTGDEFDRYRFKVPSLRNVALTAPYFHDGSAATLEDAVKTMAQFQLARTLSDEELHLIIAFLKTLTGEYKGKPLN